MTYPAGPNRYRLQRQSDGHILAVDQTTVGTAFVLTPSPARDGTYVLALSGALEVRGGRIARVVAPARTHGYAIEAIPGGTVRFRKPLVPNWTFAVSSLGAVPARRFALLGLRDGSLLLVDGKGVQTLAAARAPDSQFESAGRLKSPPTPGGDPDFDFTIDYQP